MRRLVALGLGSLVVVGGCFIGDYGTELSVTSSGGATASAASGVGGSGGSIGEGGGSSNGGAGGGGSTCLPAGQKTVEICNNGLDDGEDGHVCELKPDWVKRFGDMNDQSVLGAHLSGTGDVFFAGVFQGTLDIGSGVGNPITSPSGKSAGYAASLMKDGNPAWVAIHDPTGASGRAAGIVLGGANAYWVGDTLDMANVSQAYLQSRDAASGSMASTSIWGGPGKNAGMDITYFDSSAASSAVFTASVFAGNGLHPCVANPIKTLDAPTPISVVMKHAPGSHACTADLVLTAPPPAAEPATLGNNQPRAIDVTSDGGVVVVGTYEREIGGLPLSKPLSSPVGQVSSYVVRTNSSLNVLWHKELVASSGSIKAMDVVVSHMGGTVFVTGLLQGTLSILGRSFVSDGSDLFVMALDPSDGEAKWFSLVRGPGAAAGHSIVEYGDEIYVAGSTFGAMATTVSGSPDMDGQAVCETGFKCMFLMKFDRSCGESIWAMDLGKHVTDMDIARTARLAASDAGLLLAFDWSDFLDFKDGLPVLKGPGGTDIILAKFFSPSL